MGSKERSIQHDVNTQGAGAVVNQINYERDVQLEAQLWQIQFHAKIETMRTEAQMQKALESVNAVRDFVGNPANILGSDLTKHGEVAEYFDVYVQNARDIINGITPTSTFTGVGRTAPADYMRDGVLVQSKYTHNTTVTLEHVLEHLGKYEDIGFGRDTSYYVIPKDQYNLIQKILSEDCEDISAKTIQAVREKVSQIEQATNKSFFDVVRPGLSDYADIQMDNVSEVLDSEVHSLQTRADEQKQNIREKKRAESETARKDAQPSLQEGIRAAGMAAAVSGGIQFAFKVYQKCSEGRRIQDFTLEDWKDVGIDTAEAAVKGGVSGFALYGITNLTKVTAPLASAYISAGFGVAQMAVDFRNGDISEADFIVSSQVICIDSALSALGATVGQSLIPIPILGAVIGSAVSMQMSAIAKERLDTKEKELISQFREEIALVERKLDEKYVPIFREIQEKCQSVCDMETAAFDYNLNSRFRFEYSKWLADVVRVPREEVLRTKEDIDLLFQ